MPILNKNKPFSLHLNPDLFTPATDEEKEYITTMRPSSTFFKDGVKRLLKNKVATVSMFVLIFITIACNIGNIEVLEYGMVMQHLA